jgi:hypothetical protein
MLRDLDRFEEKVEGILGDALYDVWTDIVQLDYGEIVSPDIIGPSSVGVVRAEVAEETARVTLALAERLIREIWGVRA